MQMDCPTEEGLLRKKLGGMPGVTGLEFNLMETSFFLSRETLIPVLDNWGGMALWRERMFATMARNASSVTDYFNIPTNRVIELGTQIEI